jgi:hypothetical protein
MGRSCQLVLTFSLLLLVSVFGVSGVGNAGAGFVLRSDAVSSAGGFVSGGNTRLGMTAAQSVTGVAVGIDKTMAETVGFWRWGFLPVLGVEDRTDPEHQITQYALYPIAPNPAQRSAVIRFTIPASGGPSSMASIRVFDVSGRLVRVLASGGHAPGLHTITWDGRNGAGLSSGAGIYFVHFDAGSIRSVRRLILLR